MQWWINVVALPVKGSTSTVHTTNTNCCDDMWLLLFLWCTTYTKTQYQYICIHNYPTLSIMPLRYLIKTDGHESSQALPATLQNNKQPFHKLKKKELHNKVKKAHATQYSKRNRCIIKNRQHLTTFRFELLVHITYCGGVVVRSSDSLSRGHGFCSKLFHFHVMTLDKLFTHMCLCHQAV